MAVNVNIPKPTYTKSDVGLGNVDNTSDLNKPISTATQTALNGKVDKAIVVSTNTTATNDSIYTVVANATFTDPTPVEGKGFKVFVRNGTAVVGGVSYTVGSQIVRIFHSGSWANYRLDATDKVTANSAITGATKTKITYDSKGLVTAGADATTADIADSTDKRYVTDANLVVIGNTSNTNTGDETATTIKQKLEIFEAKQVSATQTTTGTTPIAITELKVTPTINKRYSLTACIRVGSSGSNGVIIGITAPSGATIFVTAFGTAIPGSSNSIMSFINASGGAFQNAFVLANSDNGMCVVHGEVEMGATAGDVQFTFRSATSGQTSRILKTGSFMKMEEI